MRAISQLTKNWKKVWKLEEGKASVQETHEVDDELQQFIQELEKDSQAAKYSEDCLSTQVAELATISRGRQIESANIMMPDYDERLDEEIVVACTTALSKRDKAVSDALKNADDVRQQVEKFQDELRQVRADVSKELGAMRMEYEARLNQQRKELRIELNEGQDSLDLMKMMMYAKQGLVEQLNRQLEDLERSNKSLVHAKAQADVTMSQLKAENSRLRRDLDTKTQELHLEKSLIGSKDEEIHRLEAINAGLLKAREEAHLDKISLQADLESANKRLQALEAKLGFQGRSPMIPDEESSALAGSSTSSVGRSIDTTASRPLRTTNATITLSESVAFTVSIQDAQALKLSSDVLPIDVLHTLRNKFRIWKADWVDSWATVQSSKKSRSCISSRQEKKKSEWDDGHNYACAMCEQRMRLCVVVDSAERILLLPRKAAEDQGRGPTDTKYWTR